MKNRIVTRTKVIKKLTMVFLTDPGHGWLKIDRKIIKALGLLDKVSNFSYQRGKWVFLEEDLDAPLVVEALKFKGVAVRIKNKKQSNKQSKIRSYDRFHLSLDETRELVTNNEVGALA